MFIRCKKRTTKSGKERVYAYIVENNYRKHGKTPKQKVKKYLGRVHFFEKTLKKEEIVNQDLLSQEGSFQEIITLLIEKELQERGFIKKENEYQRDQIAVNIITRQVYHKLTGKKVSLALNDGILANETLQNLIDFKTPAAKEREMGKALGNAVVSAGITINKGLFIKIFQKVMRQINDNHR